MKLFNLLLLVITALSIGLYVGSLIHYPEYEVQHKPNGYQLYCLDGDSSYGLFDGKRFVASFTAGQDKILDSIIIQDNQ